MPDEIHVHDEITEDAASRIIVKPTEPEPFAENGIQCGFDVAGVMLPKPLPSEANRETHCRG